MWAYFYFFPKYTQELEFLDVLLTPMFSLLRTVQVGNLCVVLLLQYEITTCPNSLTFVSGLCVCVCQGGDQRSISGIVSQNCPSCFWSKVSSVYGLALTGRPAKMFPVVAFPVLRLQVYYHAQFAVDIRYRTQVLFDLHRKQFTKLFPPHGKLKLKASN